ncbi:MULTISPECIES: DUF397 domain-containing protein [unclassified Streptomyces]|uniref:DUF397 domain-containing protein n=1 Tax=unclassified Streptomyces TaxID=2593676 RepID=UPI0003C2C9C5|nr:MULTISPECIES: DUF397 domain-containing protein [unclassified Streptomyces]ESQ06625.1 hypothetical protein B590_05649 [Streptomyces sp. PVA_94-07]
MSTTEDLSWFKSSYSGGDGDNCIEVARDAEAVHVRDSKDLGRDSFSVASGAWVVFTAHVSGS